jgi:hypothetical protein
MASAAMGLAALPLVCCGAGLSGALAVLLGMLALERIRASGGTLRGRGWAWTGIGSGAATVALSVAWISAVSHLWDAWLLQLDRGVRTTFAATDAASGQTALSLWGPSPGFVVSAGDVIAYASDIRARYGEFESVSLISRDLSPSLTGDHMLSFVVNFDFASGRRSGVVNARLSQAPLATEDAQFSSMASWAPSLEIASILINEPEAERGMIVFPKAAANAAAKTAPKPAETPMNGAETHQP